jgi:hypothetical protein
VRRAHHEHGARRQRAEAPPDAPGAVAQHDDVGARLAELLHELGHDPPGDDADLRVDLRRRQGDDGEQPLAAAYVLPQAEQLHEEPLAIVDRLLRGRRDVGDHEPGAAGAGERGTDRQRPARGLVVLVVCDPDVPEHITAP